MPKVKKIWSASLLVVAYFILGSFIVMRLIIKKRTRHAVVRSGLMLLLMLGAMVDIITVKVRSVDTYIAAEFINVILLLFFIRNLRENWGQIGRVIGGACGVFLLLFLFMLGFAYAGMILFG